MLAAVVNEARTLKAASIIVEFRIDLLSANTRLDIRIFVAFAVASEFVAKVAALVARAAAFVSLKVLFVTTAAALPKNNLAFAAMLAIVLPSYIWLCLEAKNMVDGKEPWRCRVKVVKS